MTEGAGDERSEEGARVRTGAGAIEDEGDGRSEGSGTNARVIEDE